MHWHISNGVVASAMVIAVVAGSAASARAQPTQSPCAVLLATTGPAGSIGLPTSGARVTVASQVAASGTPPRSIGTHCHVEAEIASLDPAAPPIRLEVNLPDAWNGKALMYGGGGFNGTPLSSPGTIRLQPADTAVPLGRGYATFSSDSGHRGSSADGSFALNDEALRNYAYDALKKTRDVAGILIAARYGRPADKVYFHGSSNGGKEALGMIQRNPADLDGAIVFWPAVDYSRLALQHARIAEGFLQSGAWPSVEQRSILLRAAVAACDAADGVKNGVIADFRQCQKTFDPATATLDGKPVVCPGGGATCVSDQQIDALRRMASPIPLPGGGNYPGFPVWGTDLGSRTDAAVARSITEQGLGTVGSAYPTRPGMPFIQNFADQYFKFFVARDPNAALPDFDPEHPGRWRSRLDELGTMLDLDGTDLSAFAGHGGKILMVHGTADQIIPVEGTERYYDAVVRTMGADRVNGFMRFYEAPMTAHSGNSLAFMPSWDILGALDTWVTDGRPPSSPVVVDLQGKPGRTMPLCQYPRAPRYHGTGSPDEAVSFSCE